MGATQGIRAGRAFVELGVSDKLTAGLRRAQRRLKAFGDGVRSIGARLARAAARAARTGNRRDIVEYLRMRRQIENQP